MFLRALILIYHWVSNLPLLAALAFVGAGAWAAANTWQATGQTSTQKRWKAVLVFVQGLIDWALLAALPYLGLSFGPVGLPLLGITAIRLLIVTGVNLGQWFRQPLSGRAAKSGLMVLVLLNLGITACAFDGLYIEPFRLTVSEIAVNAPALLPERPLRIVQLSDLHVSRITQREHDILATVAALEPDLIVLTGDYLNLSNTHDPIAQQAAHDLLAQLDAPYGIYAITAEGVDPPDAMAVVFAGLDITLLHDAVARLPLPGGDLYLIGVDYRIWEDEAPTLTRLMADIPPDATTLLLHHPPDLIEAAAAAKVDLYLAGHTHGGQIRLPFYGAIVTASVYGKRYEMGRYTIDDTILYVSRGLGMEGGGAPRARFLCPPEVVVVALGPTP